MKYIIKVPHLFYEIFELDTEDNQTPEGAIQTLVEKFKSGEQPKPATQDPLYEVTLQPEHWTAITDNQFAEMVLKAKEKETNKEETNNIITPDRF